MKKTNNFLKEVQEKIGYDFKNEMLLQQAFTRRSYSEEHPKVQNNEVLEFYGDSALGFIVSKKLAEFFGDVSPIGEYVSKEGEGQLTEIKKDIVYTTALSLCIDRLDISKFLIMGKGDQEQKVNEISKVKEDLFEAILGAVAIDCNWSLETIEKVVDMLLGRKFTDIIYSNGSYSAMTENYFNYVQRWTQIKYGKSLICSFETDNDGYKCTLKFGDWSVCGHGSSQKEARRSAAEQAYHGLEAANSLILFSDEVGFPNLDLAINQLQELEQKDLIFDLQYDFEYFTGNNNEPIWLCTCRCEYCFKEEGNAYVDFEKQSAATNKKQAKKNAAYEMLTYLFGVRGEPCS